MNGPQIHLLINHVPVMGSIFAVLLLLAGMIWKSPHLVRAALVAYVLIALATVVVDMTGDPAEQGVKQWPGVSRRDIHQHEEMGDLTEIVEGVAGVVALAGLILARRRADRTIPGWAAGLSLLLGMGAAGVAGYASHLGGLIRHPEIRSGATPPAAGTAASQGASTAAQPPTPDDDGRR
jgi:hypothetical protein